MSGEYDGLDDDDSFKIDPETRAKWATFLYESIDINYIRSLEDIIKWQGAFSKISIPGVDMTKPLIPEAFLRPMW